MEINFDKLLKNYNSELVTKLRGFNDEHDYLQYWVPGSDKTRSLINLIDAMHEADVLNFSVLILKEDEYLINEIKDISKNIGQVKIDLDEKRYKVSISFDKFKYQSFQKEQIKIKKKFAQKTFVSTGKLSDDRQNYDLLKQYKINLRNHKLISNKKKNIIDKNTFFEFITEKNKLFIKINKLTKKIVECWHDFEEENNKSIIVDKFCKIVLNKNIQEASEHGTIYLEHSIRPVDINQKIKGIILPKKVGGIFFDLHKCINKIYVKIKKKYNFNDIINKEYFGLSNDWLNISYEQKLKKLKKVLSEKIIPMLKLKNNDIIIHEIEFDTRIVIKMSDNFTQLNYGEKNYLIMVEDLFKQFVDNRLELFTIEKRDDNRLRHAKSPQKMKI